MFSTWVIEAVYVIEDRQFSGAACGPIVPPYQFSLYRFEERVNGCIVVAISFAGHGYFEAVLT